MPQPEPNEATIFDEARRLADPQQRAAFLDAACRGDDVLRQRVQELLSLQTEADAQYEKAAQQAPRALLNALPSEGSATPAVNEKAGDRIGPYKLLDSIGVGGMGAVWMAEQTEPIRRRVALKVIKQGLDTGQVMARFEAERQALALMDHPNIAKVLDAGSTPEGRPYFVMELVKGIPLLKFCDEQRLSIRQRLELFMPVCQAIQHAHQKGIIHRDIKPSNVLVALYDGQPVPKVIDFGIAKATGQQLTEKTLFTGFGAVIGTLEYMSPEQAELNQLDIDTRSDIYSLGVLLYELLTGSTPLTRETLRHAAFDEVLRRIREEEPPRPSTRLSDSKERLAILSAQRQLDPARLTKVLRGDLDWIVMKCLEKERNRRYETANGLAAEIQRHLHSEPVLAGPPTTRYRLTKFVRKHRVSVAVAAGFVVLLAAAALVATGLAIRADRERSRAVQAERASRTVLKFFQDRVLAASRPRGDGAGMGQGTTIRAAVDASEPAIAKDFAEDPLVEASIRDVLGTTYIHLGDYTNALRQHTRALELWKTPLKHDAAPTLSTLNNVASSYKKLGQLDLAMPLYEEVLRTRRATLGSRDPLTLVSMNNLATAYADAGRQDEALALHEETWKARKVILAPGHPYTLTSMSSVGNGYRIKGRVKEAVALLEEALKLHQTWLGHDHLYTSGCALKLARAYEADGRLPDALPLYRQVLDYNLAQYGPDHSNTKSSRRALARAYEQAGQSSNAVAVLQLAASDLPNGSNGGTRINPLLTPGTASQTSNVPLQIPSTRLEPR